MTPWLSLILFGAYSVHLGQDVNGDQKNYHFYNAYALLHGRLTYDRIPANSLTFVPQLYNVPFYYMALSFDPRLTGFVLGAVHGVNCVLVFFIARSLLDPAGAHRTPLALLAAAVGVWSPAALSELGTTFGDNVTSLFVLAAIFLTTSQPDTLARRARIAAAGLSAGVAAGLKYTNVTYAVAFLAALGWLSLSRRVAARTVILAAACVTAGLLIADGFWMWRLWQLYGNPVFPFLNAVFKSPYLAPLNFRDPRKTPASISEALLFPLYPLTQQRPKMEVSSRDARWAVLAVVGVLGICRWLIGRRRGAPRAAEHRGSVTRGEARTLILVFGAFGFLLWEFAFGHQRYLVTLEFLSGVLLVCVLDALFDRRRWLIAAFGLLSAVIVASVQAGNWGHRPWDRTWFGVRIPGPVSEDTMVLMVGDQSPTAYVIPFFPPRVRFVRLDSDLVRYLPGSQLAREIDGLISSHRGPFLALVTGGFPPTGDETLRRYGLRRSSEPCQRIESRLDAWLLLCSVERVQTSRIAPDWYCRRGTAGTPAGSLPRAGAAG